MPGYALGDGLGKVRYDYDIHAKYCMYVRDGEQIHSLGGQSSARLVSMNETGYLVVGFIQTIDPPEAYQRNQAEDE